MWSVEINTVVGAILFACLIKIIFMQRAVSGVAVAGVAGMTIFTLIVYDLFQYKTIVCGQSVIDTLIGDDEDNKLKCAGGTTLFAAASAAYAVAFMLVTRR